MPYELLEKEIESLTDVQQEAVILFIRFLASQDANRTVASERGIGLSFAGIGSASGTSFRERKLGGFEKGFYMAPDFDEPLEEFAEYM